MPELTDVDPALVGHLRTLGDEWGPAGVAEVAAQLVEPERCAIDYVVVVCLLLLLAAAGCLVGTLVALFVR